MDFFRTLRGGFVLQPMALPVLAFSLVAVIWASDVVAQDEGEIPLDPKLTANCLNDAPDQVSRRACIGVAAQACMDGDAEGFTTIGMMSCLDQERDWWDARLNAVYGDLIARETEVDSEMDEVGSSAPKLVPALRQMQRDWIAYRDSRCEHSMRRWGGGSGGGPAVLSCLMVTTGEQALHLEGFLDEG